jgi:hypothetical protein
MPNRQVVQSQAIGTDKHLVADAADRVGWRHIDLSSIWRAKNQAMEMTEYGKHGKP